MDIEAGICRYEGSIFRVPSPFLCAFLLYLTEGHSSMGSQVSPSLAVIIFSIFFPCWIRRLRKCRVHARNECCPACTFLRDMFFFGCVLQKELCPDSTRSRRAYSKRR